MKHAYLILAHGSYNLLQRLVTALDDERNDLFIHIDRKCTDLPELQVNQSRLFFVENRVEVYWGDVSVVEAEFALMQTALQQGKYGYFHLLSGVDLPLKTVDEIDEFCSTHNGREFIGFYQGDDLASSLKRKVQRYHLFPRAFRASGVIALTKRVVRSLAIRLQEIIHWERHKEIHFAKGTQWWSLTGDLVQTLVADRDSILRLYDHTFCSDEIAIQTYVYNSPFRDKVFDMQNEGHSCMRCIGWRNGVLYDWERKDYQTLTESNALFARKFNESDPQFLDSLRNLYS